MGRRENAREATLLWDAMERCETFKEAIDADAPALGDIEQRYVKLVVGDFSLPHYDGTHHAALVLDATTGRRIFVEAERIIRERMVELGQLDASELTIRERTQ